MTVFRMTGMHLAFRIDGMAETNAPKPSPVPRARVRPASASVKFHPHAQGGRTVSNGAASSGRIPHRVQPGARTRSSPTATSAGSPSR